MPTRDPRRSSRRTRRPTWLLLVGALLTVALVPLAACVAKPADAAVAAAPVSSARAHFTVNLKGSYSAAVAAGFNVFDVAGSQNNPAGVKAKLATLPAGSKAMIWSVASTTPHRLPASPCRSSRRRWTRSSPTPVSTATS